MNTKFLKQAFVLFLGSLIFAGTALWFAVPEKNHNRGGERLFANTAANIGNLGQITIETDGNIVNFRQEDSLWRVLEAGNYYAGYRQINNLFNDLETSRIFRRIGKETPEDKQKYGLDKQEAVRIITRLRLASIMSVVVIPKSKSIPSTPRKSLLHEKSASAASAYLPTTDRLLCRKIPPNSIMSILRSFDKMMATCSEAVITVSLSVVWIQRAKACMVVPDAIKMESFFAIKLAACIPISLFSSV